MARLLTFPNQLAGVVSITPTRGPNARSSGNTTAMDGTEQSFSGTGDVVALDLELSIKQGTWARRDRGHLTALRSGANAMRLTFHDPDIMSPAEAGITSLFLPNSSPEIVANVGDQGGVSWSNGEPWSNGFNWQVAYPTVAVAAAAAYDDGVVSLADTFWGHGLGIGDHLGFFPFSFGLYTVEEVISAGQYRIWPRLRTALTTSHFATLTPTIVMKPTLQSTVPPGRNLVSTATHTLSLVEVIDPYVRSSFTE